MMTKIHVFLSYARNDLPLCEAVDDLLTEAGVSCMRDVKEAGADWKKRISYYIDRAHCILLIGTPDIVNGGKLSEVIEWEIGEAIKRGKPIRIVQVFDGILENQALAWILGNDDRADHPPLHTCVKDYRKDRSGQQGVTFQSRDRALWLLMSAVYSAAPTVAPAAAYKAMAETTLAKATLALQAIGGPDAFSDIGYLRSGPGLSLIHGSGACGKSSAMWRSVLKAEGRIAVCIDIRELDRDPLEFVRQVLLCPRPSLIDEFAGYIQDSSPTTFVLDAIEHAVQRSGSGNFWANFNLLCRQFPVLATSRPEVFHSGRLSSLRDVANVDLIEASAWPRQYYLRKLYTDCPGLHPSLQSDGLVLNHIEQELSTLAGAGAPPLPESRYAFYMQVLLSHTHRLPAVARTQGRPANLNDFLDDLASIELKSGVTFGVSGAELLSKGITLNSLDMFAKNPMMRYDPIGDAYRLRHDELSAANCLRWLVANCRLKNYAQTPRGFADRAVILFALGELQAGDSDVPDMVFDDLVTTFRNKPRLEKSADERAKMDYAWEATWVLQSAVRSPSRDVVLTRILDILKECKDPPVLGSLLSVWQALDSRDELTPEPAVSVLTGILERGGQRKRCLDALSCYPASLYHEAISALARQQVACDTALWPRLVLILEGAAAELRKNPNAPQGDRERLVELADALRGHQDRPVSLALWAVRSQTSDNALREALLNVLNVADPSSAQGYSDWNDIVLACGLVNSITVTHGSPIISALGHCLDHPMGEARRAACDALVRLGSFDALAVLLRRFVAHILAPEDANPDHAFMESVADFLQPREGRPNPCKDRLFRSLVRILSNRNLEHEGARRVLSKLQSRSNIADDEALTDPFITLFPAVPDASWMYQVPERLTLDAESVKDALEIGNGELDPDIGFKLRFDIQLADDGTPSTSISRGSWTIGRGFHRFLERNPNRAVEYTSRLLGSYGGACSLPGIASLHAICVTADDQVVLARRPDDVEYFPGYWSASFEEGLQEVDLDHASMESTVRRCAARGMLEECIWDGEFDITHWRFGIEHAYANIVVVAVLKLVGCLNDVQGCRAKLLRDRERTDQHGSGEPADRAADLDFASLSDAERISAFHSLAHPTVAIRFRLAQKSL